MADLREQIRTVTTRVGGRVPFTGESWSGLTRPGIELAFNESFKLYHLLCTGEASLWHHVRRQLEPGETAHFIDYLTGAPMPITIPVGHIYTNFSVLGSGERKTVVRGYIGTVELGIPQQLAALFATETLGETYEFSNYLTGSNILDPTAQYSHPIDLTIQNLNSKSATGYAAFLFIDKAIGTPPWPTEKTVVCKWCGAKKKVKIDVTYVKCNKCGKTTLYYPLVRGGLR